MCTGRRSDAYATINSMQEISWEIGYLFGNVHTGIGEFVGMGYRVDDMQMMQTIESQVMTSHGSCTKRSHKSIAQTNRKN